MKVAIVTETFPPEINGVAMTVGKLVDGLLTRNHEVLLFRPIQHRNDQPKQEPCFQEHLVWGIPIPRYHGLKFGSPAFWTLFYQFRRQRVDIVHVVTEGPLGWAAIWVANRLNIPVTSSFHTNFHSYMEHYDLVFLQKLTCGHLRSLHNATKVTFVPTKQLMEELTQLGFKNLTLLSRGVDIARFKPDHRSEELRASWGASPEDLVILHVGRVAPEKNIDLLMQAFARICLELPTAKLVFVGDGPLKKQLQTDWPQVIFTGSKSGDELATHYASGDLFLFPSVTETYGNVTSEALASGLCVLAYDYAAASELIANGENGVTVKLNETETFVLESLAIAKDAKRRKALAAKARESIYQRDWHFVYDAFINKLHEVYARRSGIQPIVEDIDDDPTEVQLKLSEE